LMPLLLGQSDKWDRDAVYYHYYEYPSIHMVKRHYAIVNKDYKLIHFYYDVDEWELYDRKNDPKEMKNVYDDPAYASIKKKLHVELDGLRQKYGDSSQISQELLEKYLEEVDNTQGSFVRSFKKVGNE